MSAKSNIKNDSNLSWIIISATSKRKLVPENITKESSKKSQKRDPSQSIESKNILIKLKERANSWSIQEMLLLQQETNIMN